MPSESSFKHHTELVRNALRTFTTIQQLDAPGPIKTALNELITATADFQNFVPFFVNHTLFLEIPPLVYTTLEEFFSKNPSFDKPPLYGKLAGLNARVKDSLAISAKKGTSSPFLLRAPFLRFEVLAALSAAPLRPEKKPRVSAKATPGVRFLPSQFLRNFAYPFLVFQGKRPRISKEFVDSEDDIAEFLDDATPSLSKCSDCGTTGHTLKTCPSTTIPSVGLSSFSVFLLFTHFRGPLRERSPLLRPLTCLWMWTVVRHPIGSLLFS